MTFYELQCKCKNALAPLTSTFDSALITIPKQFDFVALFMQFQFNRSPFSFIRKLLFFWIARWKRRTVFFSSFLHHSYRSKICIIVSQFHKSVYTICFLIFFLLYCLNYFCWMWTICLNANWIFNVDSNDGGNVFKSRLLRFLSFFSIQIVAETPYVL